MIPRVVHLFHNHDFFHNNQNPDSTHSLCLATWHQHLDGYKICLWHEKLPEFQEMLKTSRYLRECYSRKIWPAVSDYVRAWVLYHHGGIYLDTDIYLLQSLDSLLQNQAFAFAVPVPGRIDPLVWHVEPAIFGAVAGHQVVKQVLDIYQSDELFESPLWIANQVFSLAILRATEDFIGQPHQPLQPGRLPVTCPDMLVPKLGENKPVKILDPDITLYPPKMMEQGGQIMHIRGRWFVVAGHESVPMPQHGEDVFSFQDKIAYHVCQNSWNKSRYYLETKHMHGWTRQKKLLEIWLSLPQLANIKRDFKIKLCRLVGNIFF